MQSQQLTTYYQHYKKPQEPIARSAGRPVIRDLFPNPIQKPAFSDFDALLTELEESPEYAEELADAHRWVATEFYADQLTLASLRLQAGLSQRRLGQILNINQSHISRYESGKHEPSFSLANQMAVALKVDMETLYKAWSNSKNQKKPDDQHD
ncbi:hypothetical protein C2U68_17215 [Methylomonas koyamae]|nr:hypothetical protein C2U68_17215 [Methylomonas koyamae]